MQINVEKRYAVLIFVGLLALAGSWVVYAVDTSQGWHSANEIEEADPTVIASVKDGVSWDEVSGKPDLCESNGNGCPDINSGSDSPLAGLDVIPVNLNGKFGLFSPSFNEVVTGEVGESFTYTFSIRISNGNLESRLQTTSPCGNSNSDWHVGNYDFNFKHKYSRCSWSQATIQGHVVLRNGVYTFSWGSSQDSVIIKL